MPESKELLRNWFIQSRAVQLPTFRIVFPPQSNDYTGSDLDFASPKLVFPGAFNPLHAAHVEMASIAASKMKSPLWLEISVTNVDKLLLDWADLNYRVTQNFDPHGLICTNAPTFVQKSQLFPNTVFVVGADTILRIADLKYYNHSKSNFDLAVKEISNNRCRFLVFGRKIDNNFVDNQNIILGDRLFGLCSFVEQSEFRNDLSSTEIRNQANVQHENGDV